jgi:hypothetical protein
MSNVLKIDLVPGGTAPRYANTRELKVQRAVITEQGTQANLPIVDFIMEDDKGNLFLLVLTGRLVNMVSAAVKGVNMRNHGVEEP